jgi:hypothetical protein
MKDFKRKQEDKLQELKRKNDHADYMITVYEEKMRKARKNAGKYAAKA